MILTKGKQSFWSQLFISMIAIFALPEVCATERTEYPREYQNQSIQQQNLRTIYQVQQKIQQQAQILNPKIILLKLAEIQPHFFSKVWMANTPIRGSPHFL